MPANLALARLYGGAAFTPSSARAFGAGMASADFAGAQLRRKALLTHAVQTGAIQPQQLGAFDRSLLGFQGGVPRDVAGHSSFLGHLGGFFTNLGADVRSFGIHFVPGLYEAGKAAVEAAAAPITGQGFKEGTKNPFTKNVIDPMLHGYKQTYGSGHILASIYHHPLGPILDLASIASLGLGGAARAGGAIARGAEAGSDASRLGLRLAQFTSPEGRAPLGPVDREFSTQPLRRLQQQGLDALGVRLPRIGGLQERAAIRSFTKRSGSEQAATEAQNIDAAVRPLGDALKSLDQDQQHALMLSLIGANTPQRLEAFQQSVRDTLANKHPEGENMNFSELEHLGVTRSYLERQAYITPRVRELVLDPTQQMEHAAEQWAADVERGRQQLEIPQDIHQQHVADMQSRLFGNVDPGDNLDERMKIIAQKSETARDDSRGFARGWQGVVYHGAFGQDARETIIREGFDPNASRGGIPTKGTVFFAYTPEGAKYGPRVQAHVTLKRPMTFWWDPEATPRSKFARDQGKTGEMMSDPPEAAALGWGGKDLAELGRRLGYDGAIFPRRDEMQVFDPNAIKEITPYETGGVHPNPRIAPNYVPAQLASGFRETSPGAIGRAMGRGTRVTRDRRDRQLSPTAVTAQNLLSEARPRYLHESTGSTFASGAFRTDARALLDHTAQRERDLVQRAFNEKLVNRMTVHDHEGTAIEAKNTTEMRGKLVAAGLNPDKYVLVHTQFPIQWFRAEHNSLEQMLHTIEELKKQGATETNPAVEAYLEKLQNTQAEAFIKSHWGAIKRNGVAVPKDFFDYQRAIAGVNDPFNNPFGNFYARMMHRWRNLTLAYMPRWALNTAAGSFLMAMTKGIVNPRDYLEGNRLERQGLLPAGINMRSLAPADFLEPGGIGYQDIGDVRFPTRDIYHRVQSIEDFFRRAGFVQSLRGQAKIQMRSIGEDLKSFYGELDDKPLIEQWLNDPKLVQRAVADVNKFSYAFGELSPFERRYVRQFIPFWGWYKFITKFAWRLPVDYPGRANIIQAFSSVGADAEHDVGKMPEWIQGSILLNLVGGKLHYMTALGINPLAQFANPARGFGGLLQLSQGSPAIQMILAGAGIDTLRGGTVPISPQEHVGKGSFGDLRDTRTGQLVNPATRGGFRRVIMAALRSIPEARIAERVYEGGPTYPESVPLLADRPMPPTKSTQPPSFMEDVVLPYLGVNLKTYDLANYQRLTKKQLAAAQKSAKRDLNRIKHGR